MPVDIRFEENRVYLSIIRGQEVDYYDEQMFTHIAAIDRSIDKSCAVVSYFMMGLWIFDKQDLSDQYLRIKKIAEINEFLKQQSEILHGLNKSRNPERLVKNLVLSKRLLNYPLSVKGDYLC